MMLIFTNKELYSPCHSLFKMVANRYCKHCIDLLRFLWFFQSIQKFGVRSASPFRLTYGQGNSERGEVYTSLPTRFFYRLENLKFNGKKLYIVNKKRHTQGQKFD